jgi:16S rRNA (guanine527-N7)-methyltransferase
LSNPEVPHSAEGTLRGLIALLAEDPSAPSAVRDPDEAWRVHIADSLAGLEVEPLRRAVRIGDVGTGAGFPGIPLAAALPGTTVDLIEATGRKCAFLRRAVSRLAIPNANVLCRRAEDLARSPGPEGRREHYDAVTARAVGRLSTLAELASPLLAEGGVLVAWKGRRDAEEEAELSRAAAVLAMVPVETRWVGPYAGSRHRHLHVMRKSGPTPEGLPRRPGMAKKRPRGTA